MQHLVVTQWPLTLPIAMLASAWAWHARTFHRGSTSKAEALAPLLAPARSASPRSDHWLSEWLADIGDHSPSQAEHAREFHQRPDVVFAALVQVLTAEAHIEQIEGFGTVAVFACGHHPVGGSRALRAQVSPSGGYTVLEISSPQAAPATLAERQRECAQIHQLLSVLAHRLHGTTRIGRVAPPPGGRIPAQAGPRGSSQLDDRPSSQLTDRISA
jgi:hypothetical protein